MFDIIAMLLFGVATISIMIYTFKPVMDTMKRDEIEREQKKQNDHTVRLNPHN